GLQVVLTGTDAERDVVVAVAGAMHAPAVDICGRTDIGAFAALLGRASLVLSNDTGAAHVAAAVRTPSVVVFAADGDPDRWAPLDTDRHRQVLPGHGPDRWPAVAAVVRAVDHQLARHDLHPGRRTAGQR